MYEQQGDFASQNSKDLRAIPGPLNPERGKVPATDLPESGTSTTQILQRQCSAVERKVLCESLFKELDCSNRRLSEAHTFVGLGFGKDQTPIDIIPLILPAIHTRRHTVLIVDGFLELNGAAPAEVAVGTQRILDTIESMKQHFELQNSLQIELASEHMHTPDYRQVQEELKNRLECHPERDTIHALLEATVPPSRRATGATDYAFQEIVMVEYLRQTLAVDIKVGPERERAYDQIMKMLDIPIGFAYAVDALPIGTKHPEPVVHYIPTHRGRRQGNRIMFEDSPEEVERKLAGSHPQSIAALEKMLLITSALKGSRVDCNQESLAERVSTGLIAPINAIRGGLES